MASRFSALGAALRWTLLGGVFLVSAEAFVRIDQYFTWGAPLVGPWSNEHLMVRDSLGLHGRPGYRFEKWKLNNEGFRGSDMRLVLAPGRARVAVLGASETFGLYEPEGREYPAQLRRLLDSLAPGRFDVVNVALAGMSLSAMAPYVRNYVARLQPRYILLYPSPTFYLEVNPPLSSTEAPVAPVAPARQPAQRSLPVMHSRLLAKSRDVLKEIVPVWAVSAYREWSLERQRAEGGPGWTWDRVPEERMALLREQLDRLVGTIAATGAIPVLATHTNRFVGMTPEEVRQDHRHLLNLQAVYYPRASDAVMIKVDSAANAMIRAVAATHRVPVIEIEGRIPAGAEYFADYAHFTDAGATRMARLLADGLLAIEGVDRFRIPAGQ